MWEIDRLRKSWSAPLRLAIALSAVLLGAGTCAQAAERADCLSAFTPYSSRTPLMDLLIDPRTKAVLEAQGMLKDLPPIISGDTPPNISSILTPRMILSHDMGPIHRPPGGLAAADKLDRDLGAIPVTEEAAIRRCARFDHTPPVLPPPDHHPALLVFEKINGFRDGPSVDAAHKAFAGMAARNGWSITFTENGAVFNPTQLKRYDVVVWNNNSGDILTLSQEKAFQDYLAGGGGFAGVHGAGGDPSYFWRWYPDTLIGAQFSEHTMNPQFQTAVVVVEQPKTGITAHLPDHWSMTEEWYSFVASARLTGAHVLARLDEDSYHPGPGLRMGDHPIAWSRCLGNGRAFYTAIGHRPESYTEPNSLELLTQGVAWAAGVGATRCEAGREVGR